MTSCQQYFRKNGFAILDGIFAPEEVARIIDKIDRVGISGPSFRKTTDLFAIRRFLKEVPGIQPLIFNPRLNTIIKEYFGPDYFVIKSLYFDKPESSNWFVAWHQDLTISVDKKLDLPGFGCWTVKQDQFAVQPTEDILENIFTIRIHLDDTDETNGALKAIPGSHLRGVYKPSSIDWNNEEEAICEVKSGGIMIMRPLLMHASNRASGHNRRRVIHIEFSNHILPGNLDWGEKEKVEA